MESIDEVIIEKNRLPWSITISWYPHGVSQLEVIASSDPENETRRWIGAQQEKGSGNDKFI